MELPEAVRAVRRMQAYIEAHLFEPVTLYQLANEAGYSPYHSARLFQAHTGKAPFQYLRARRLSRAALYLRDHEARVIDVALDFVFDSHEGFTRAFTRAFGVPPKQYSLQTPPIPLFLPYPASEYPLMKEKGVKRMEENKDRTIFVQVIERPQRKALIRRGKEAEEYFAYCEEVGCDVWAILVSVKEALYEPVGMWMPPAMIKPGTSRYVQGVEVPVDYANAVPEGFELIDLPPCKLMVFQGPPFQDEVFMDAISHVIGAMDRYDPKLYGFTWADEDGPRIQLEPQGYRGYIEARPVRSL